MRAIGVSIAYTTYARLRSSTAQIVPRPVCALGIVLANPGRMAGGKEPHGFLGPITTTTVDPRLVDDESLRPMAQV